MERYKQLAVSIKGVEGKSVDNITAISGGNVINSVISIALIIAGMVAVGAIIFGGYKYMFANGDVEKAKKATSLLIRAIIGLIIVIASYAITSFVVGRV